jgi:hypothetical protein
MNKDAVVIETTSGMLEAEILRGLLESRGLTVQLFQEAAGKIYGLGVGRLGQVDLMVPIDQADEARQIMADDHSGRLMEDDGSLDS